MALIKKPMTKKPIPKSPQQIAEEKRLARNEAARLAAEKAAAAEARRSAERERKAREEHEAYTAEWDPFGPEIVDAFHFGGLDNHIETILKSAVKRQLALGAPSLIPDWVGAAISEYNSDNISDPTIPFHGIPNIEVPAVGAAVVQMVPTGGALSSGRDASGKSDGSGDWWVDPKPNPHYSGNLYTSEYMSGRTIERLTNSPMRAHLKGNVVKLDASGYSRGRRGGMRAWHNHYLQIDRASKQSVTGHFVGEIPYGWDDSGGLRFAYSFLLVDVANMA